MSVSARLHLRRLATSWDDRPEIVRTWVAFFRRSRPWPPLEMIAIFGVAFAIVGMLSSGYEAFVDSGGAVSLASPAARHWLWRFVLFVGVGAGMIAQVPGARAPETMRFRMLPWARERHMTGVALSAMAYALAMVAGVLVVEHDLSLALATAGVVMVVLVCTVSVADVLARVRSAMLGVGVIAILIVAPAPLSVIADAAPIVTAVAAVAGALWMISGAYAPSLSVRRRVGTVDPADVREMLPERMRWMVDTPQPREGPPPVYDRRGPPQTYKRWSALRGAIPFSWGAFALGVGYAGVVMPLIGYLFGSAQTAFMFMMAPIDVASDHSHRLPPLTRRARARWAFRYAAKSGFVRLATVLAGTALFALWDPLPGVRSDHGSPISVLEFQGLAFAAFAAMLPAFIWFTTWLPEGAPVDPQTTGGRRQIRLWVTSFSPYLVGIVVAALTMLALTKLLAATPAWSIVAAMVSLVVVANWLCWRLVERRYLTKDLIK